MQSSDQAAATTVTPEHTPRPPLMCPLSAVNRGGYTPYTAHFLAQTQAYYPLPTGRSII